MPPLPKPEKALGTFATALAGDKLKLVTEIKPASPSAGVLQSTVDLPRILESYDRYAAAISVLTDHRFFGGSFELLANVVRKSSRPALCKDFVLDLVQVYQARLAGAEAVLLIVKILTDQELARLFAAIGELGMTPVVEIQNERELDRAMTIDPTVLLINNRDLETFQIALETTKGLAPLIPKEVMVISASGIHHRGDIETLLPYCSRFLIGTALMQSADLSRTLRELSGQ